MNFWKEHFRTRRLMLCPSLSLSVLLTGILGNKILSVIVALSLSFAGNRTENFMSTKLDIPCPSGHRIKYKFDFIYPTIVSFNDWICHNSGPKFMAHSVYWFGSIFGVLIIGFISDKFCSNLFFSQFSFILSFSLFRFLFFLSLSLRNQETVLEQFRPWIYGFRFVRENENVHFIRCDLSLSFSLFLQERERLAFRENTLT